MGYNDVNPGNAGDMGSLIKLILEKFMSTRINTAYLAKVTEVKTSSSDNARVDVEFLNKSKFNDKFEAPQTAKNLVVGFFGFIKWGCNWNIQKGDIGLVIVNKFDMGGYLDNGDTYEPTTDRNFDAADGVFIPLSMYLQKPIEEDYLKLEEKDGHWLASLMSDGATAVNNDGFKLDITKDGDTTFIVGGDSEKFNLEITKDGDLTVKNEKTTVEMKGQDGSLTIKSGGDLTIEDGNKNKLEMTSNGITITVGASKIELTSSGINITGTVVKVNNGNLQVM